MHPDEKKLQIGFSSMAIKITIRIPFLYLSSQIKLVIKFSKILYS